MAQHAGSRDAEDARPLVTGYLLQGLLALALVTAAVAILLIWMFLTAPIEVARTVQRGSTMDVARLVATAIYDLVANLAAWL